MSSLALVPTCTAQSVISMMLNNTGGRFYCVFGSRAKSLTFAGCGANDAPAVLVLLAPKELAEGNRYLRMSPSGSQIFVTERMGYGIKLYFKHKGTRRRRYDSGTALTQEQVYRPKGLHLYCFPLPIEFHPLYNIQRMNFLCMK